MIFRTGSEESKSLRVATIKCLDRKEYMAIETGDKRGDRILLYQNGTWEIILPGSTRTYRNFEK